MTRTLVNAAVRRLIRSCRVPGLILLLSLPGLTKPKPAKSVESGLAINLCVYNLATVSPEVLAQADRETSRIFGRTGVQIAWSDYPLVGSAEELESGQTCGPPFGPSDVRLRILPRRLAELAGTHPRSLGLALPCADEGGGCFVNVFYQRAQELAKDGGLSLGKVLGHAIAHEIGHLLLGSNAHSPVGLMRAHWGPEDLHRADKGDLLLGTEEAVIIRAHVAGRMKRCQELSQQLLLNSCSTSGARGGR